MASHSADDLIFKAHFLISSSLSSSDHVFRNELAKCKEVTANRDPNFNPSLAKHLPGWGRAVGTAVGALGSGLSHYNQAKTQTNAVKKLVNPQALRQTFDQLSNERQYGNNQIGNYRLT